MTPIYPCGSLPCIRVPCMRFSALIGFMHTTPCVRVSTVLSHLKNNKTNKIDKKKKKERNETSIIHLVTFASGMLFLFPPLRARGNTLGCQHARVLLSLTHTHYWHAGHGAVISSCPIAVCATFG